jgi:hypothetical protein
MGVNEREKKIAQVGWAISCENRVLSNL